MIFDYNIGVLLAKQKCVLTKIIIRINFNNCLIVKASKRIHKALKCWLKKLRRNNHSKKVSASFLGFVKTFISNLSNFRKSSIKKLFADLWLEFNHLNNRSYWNLVITIQIALHVSFHQHNILKKFNWIWKLGKRRLKMKNISIRILSHRKSRKKKYDRTTITPLYRHSFILHTNTKEIIQKKSSILKISTNLS